VSPPWSRFCHTLLFGRGPPDRGQRPSRKRLPFQAFSLFAVVSFLSLGLYYREPWGRHLLGQEVFPSSRIFPLGIFFVSIRPKFRPSFSLCYRLFTWWTRTRLKYEFPPLEISINPFMSSSLPLRSWSRTLLPTRDIRFEAMIHLSILALPLLLVTIFLNGPPFPERASCQQGGRTMPPLSVLSHTFFFS